MIDGKPTSLIPFTKGQTVIEVMKDREYVNDPARCESKAVKIVWNDDDVCRTESGFEYSRMSGMEVVRDPRIYRAVHSPDYSNEANPGA